MFPVKSCWHHATLFALLACITTSAQALKVNGAVSVDLDYTDNATLVSTNQTEDIITTGRISAAVSEDQGALTGSAKASLSYSDYLNNSFGEQTYFRLGAAASWKQIRNVLTWNINDYFSQASVNNLAAGTPDNTEDINAFNIAAQLTFRPADRHTVTITPSFKDYYYQTSPNDNQQTGLAAGWAYSLNPTTSLSLGGNLSKVDYENDLGSPDFTRQNVDVGISVVHHRLQYNARLGATAVDRDAGGDSDGFSAALNVVYKITGRSTINANVSSDITDTSAIFLASSLDPNSGNFNNVQISSDVVRDNVFRIAYSRSGSTVKSSVWMELRKLDYSSLLNDRKVQEYGLITSYNLTPKLTPSVKASYVKTDEDSTGLTDKYYNASGQLNYALSRKLTTNAGVKYQTKNSSNSLNDYDELSITAALSYRLGR